MRADENVQDAQRRLKQGGFYTGNISGVYDDGTAAAVTRYQIRHGLAISGKLDGATAQALGVSARADEAQPVQTSGTWRRLRNGDMQFLEQLNAGSIPPPRAPVASSPESAPAPRKRPSGLESHALPPPPAEGRTTDRPPPPDTRVEGVPPPHKNDYGTERLRDYVAAFVLAGLDPKIGAELEFFADRVDYFGERNVGRQTIQRDLLRYDRKWPKRRFWLAGNPEVETESSGELRVTLPLRYDLRSRSRHASGEVMKTLTLLKTDDGDLQIIAVNESKAGEKEKRKH